MKIICISDTRISYNIHRKNLYIDELKREHDVEVWDCSRWYGNYDKTIGLNDHYDCIEIGSKEEFHKNLARVTESAKNVFALHSMMMEAYMVIARTLKRFHVRSVCLEGESHGRWLRYQLFYEHRRELSWKNRIKAVFQHDPLVRKLYFRIHYRGIRFEYSFGRVNYLPEVTEQFLYGHYRDYDTILGLQDADKMIDGNYALFIDTAFATHPGWKKFQDRPDSARYYKEVRTYLDAFEKAAGMQVIIAAYPKTAVSAGAFGSRKIFYGKTPELIKYADVVFMHYSSVIEITIALQKPVIFLYDREWKHGCTKAFYYFSKYFADRLGMPWQEMSRLEIPKIEMDAEKYKNYTDSEIVYGQKKMKRNSEILAEYMQEIIEGK